MRSESFSLWTDHQEASVQRLRDSWWVHPTAEVCYFSPKCITTRRLRRYRKTTTALTLKTTTPCNRWMIFLSIPYPHFILFSLVIPRRVANFCDSVNKILNRAKKLHTYATCVRNLLIVKNLEHGKFKEWYNVKEKRLLYRFLTFW